jgi:hypothetical protein
MRRAVRALRKEGEVPERVEVDQDGNFAIILAPKRDTPEQSDVDVIHGLDAGEAA